MKRIEQLKKYLPRTTYKKMDKTWKKFERDIAKELTSLGDMAERVPITGRTRGSAPDVESLIFLNPQKDDASKVLIFEFSKISINSSIYFFISLFFQYIFSL